MMKYKAFITNPTYSSRAIVTPSFDINTILFTTIHPIEKEGNDISNIKKELKSNQFNSNQIKS
jgi:hypothetical protein